MKKHILISATAALLAWPNLSFSVLAAPPQASEGDYTELDKGPWSISKVAATGRLYKLREQTYLE